MVKERNYGIDFLRLILMFMVCTLHILGHGGVLNACDYGSLNHKVYWFLEILSYCAVDGFVLISGYMSVDKPLNVSKILEMWFQVFFYSVSIPLVLWITGINTNYDIWYILKCGLPIITERYWFFTAYFALFLIMPILNKFIFSISKNASKKILILTMILFSIVGLFLDPFKTLNGYSTLWLVVIYFMGALAKKINLFEKVKSIILVLVWAFCIILTWIVRVFADSEFLTSYVSPTIIISGFIMVVLFSRIKFNGKIISKISPLAFGVYLFQDNPDIRLNLIKNNFVFITNENVFVGVLIVLLSVFVCFVAGILVEFIRKNLASLIKIPDLCKKIVSSINKCLEKIL